MRALSWSEDALTVIEHPAPVPGPGEVLLEISHCGVNRADLLQRRGLYPPPAGVTPVLGLECAGTVREVGPEISPDLIGRPLMALLPGGAYADLATAPLGSTLPQPTGWSSAEAAAFPEAGATAYLNLVRLAEVATGDPVLVHGGSGGVGTTAIQLLRTYGCRVFTSAGSADRRARCVELGAELALDYATDDVAEEVLRATDGAGVRAILDCVGAAAFASNLRCLAPDGRLVLIGLMGGRHTEIDLAVLLKRRLRIEGSTLRNLADAIKAELLKALWSDLRAPLEDGRIRPVVDRVVSWEQAEEAHRALAAGEIFGKVVLEVSR